MEINSTGSHASRLQGMTSFYCSLSLHSIYDLLFSESRTMLKTLAYFHDLAVFSEHHGKSCLLYFEIKHCMEHGFLLKGYLVRICFNCKSKYFYHFLLIVEQSTLLKMRCVACYCIFYAYLQCCLLCR